MRLPHVFFPFEYFSTGTYPVKGSSGQRDDKLRHVLTRVDLYMLMTAVLMMININY